jgi:signal transduction histidine kinase
VTQDSPTGKQSGLRWLRILGWGVAPAELFDAATQPKGSGLQNMVDRLDALGGGVTVDSARGRGTRISGRIPVATAIPVGAR